MEDNTSNTILSLNQDNTINSGRLKPISSRLPKRSTNIYSSNPICEENIDQEEEIRKEEINKNYAYNIVIPERSNDSMVESTQNVYLKLVMFNIKK